ncbi:MAG: flagellar hook-length control protein FliK [Deltaproteobacteria bacterium]|nr:flagellar hook-length control protein FliK [Deltaproteobacteria bacterium]
MGTVRATSDSPALPSAPRPEAGAAIDAKGEMRVAFSTTLAAVHAHGASLHSSTSRHHHGGSHAKAAAGGDEATSTKAPTDTPASASRPATDGAQAMTQATAAAVPGESAKMPRLATNIAPADDGVEIEAATPPAAAADGAATHGAVASAATAAAIAAPPVTIAPTTAVTTGVTSTVSTETPAAANVPSAAGASVGLQVATSLSRGRTPAAPASPTGATRAAQGPRDGGPQGDGTVASDEIDTGTDAASPARDRGVAPEQAPRNVAVPVSGRDESDGATAANQAHAAASDSATSRDGEAATTVDAKPLRNAPPDAAAAAPPPDATPTTAAKHADVEAATYADPAAPHADVAVGERAPAPAENAPAATRRGSSGTPAEPASPGRETPRANAATVSVRDAARRDGAETLATGRIADASGRPGPSEPGPRVAIAVPAAASPRHAVGGAHVGQPHGRITAAGEQTAAPGRSGDTADAYDGGTTNGDAGGDDGARAEKRAHTGRIGDEATEEGAAARRAGDGSLARLTSGVGSDAGAPTPRAVDVPAADGDAGVRGATSAAGARDTSASITSGTEGTPTLRRAADASVSPWAERVVESVRVATLRGGGEMRLRLEPAGLGHIDVRITLAHDGIHASIVAEHDTTRALLRSEQHLLHAALERSDLRLAGFSVDLGSGASTSAFGDAERGAAGLGRDAAAPSEPEAIAMSEFIQPPAEPGRLSVRV